MSMTLIKLLKTTVNDCINPLYMGRRVFCSELNFQSNSFDELGFLIGNKKNESFKLEINKIEIK